MNKSVTIEAAVVGGRRKLEEDLAWARRDAEKAMRQEGEERRRAEGFRRAQEARRGRQTGGGSGEGEIASPDPLSCPIRGSAAVGGVRISAREAAAIVEAFERAMSEGAAGVRLAHVRYA